MVLILIIPNDTHYIFINIREKDTKNYLNLKIKIS